MVSVSSITIVPWCHWKVGPTKDILKSLILSHRYPRMITQLHRTSRGKRGKGGFREMLSLLKKNNNNNNNLQKQKTKPLQLRSAGPQPSTAKNRKLTLK